MLQESEIIQLASQLNHPVPWLECGIDDDTAVLNWDSTQKLLWTTDILIEGVHFLPNFSPQELGWKCLAVNLSDIAAMGGMPLAYLLSLGLPISTSDHWIKAFFKGLQTCGEAYGAVLIGGDTVRSEQVTVNITVLGRSPSPIYRRGSQVGDKIVVTGDYGAAAAGLYALQHGKEKAYPELVKRQTTPSPRLEAGQKLAAHFSRLSMLDASDGLGRSLQLLCEPSNLGFQVELERVPVHPDVKKLAAESGQDWIKWLIHGGEEFELVCAIPASESDSLPFLDIPFTIIGEITDTVEYLFFWQEETIQLPCVPAGYQHFNRSGGPT